MRFHRDSRLTRFALFAFFLAVALYALFEIRGQLVGPTITLNSIPRYTSDALVHVSGQALRISSLSMDGGAITVTENGSFDEPYLLAPGYNLIVLDATDAFGRKEERTIAVVYDPPPLPSSPIENASTSVASSTLPLDGTKPSAN